MEICIVYFTPYRETIQDTLNHLYNLLKTFIGMRLCLSNEKFITLMVEGIVLGHHIYCEVIRVDIAKINSFIVYLDLKKTH